MAVEKAANPIAPNTPAFSPAEINKTDMYKKVEQQY